jgi:hypothetical protein
MARPRKTPVWVIVLADNLGCIDENMVLNPGSEPKKSLLDELLCPVADEVLIALRKSFSLTYPRNPFIDGLQQALTEIRRIGVEALKEMPKVLEELRLAPVPGTTADAAAHRAIVFKFVLARSADLAVKVQYEGKSRSLLKLLDPYPADQLVRTLREVISDTFSEMYSDEQHRNPFSVSDTASGTRCQSSTNCWRKLRSSPLRSDGNMRIPRHSLSMKPRIQASVGTRLDCFPR